METIFKHSATTKLTSTNDFTKVVKEAKQSKDTSGLTSIGVFFKKVSNVLILF